MSDDVTPMFEGVLSSASALDSSPVGSEVVSPRGEQGGMSNLELVNQINALFTPSTEPRKLRFVSEKLLDLKEVHPWKGLPPLIADPVQYEFQNRSTLYCPQWSRDPKEYLQNVDDGIGAVKWGIENGIPNTLCLDDRHAALISHVAAEVERTMGDAIGKIYSYHGGDFVKYGFGTEEGI